MSENTPLVENLLRAATPQNLLRTYAALTHYMHDSDKDLSADLRAQRDKVEDELLSRMASPVITDVDLNRAAQAFYEGADGAVRAMTDKPNIVNGLRAALTSLGVRVPDEQD